MAKNSPAELTVREVAERLGAAIPTVTLWCRDRRFPNARQEDTPRGPVWYIPETDLEGVEMRGRGRPPKANSNKAATQPASGSNAALTAGRAKKNGNSKK